jgi:hypothetical protein
MALFSAILVLSAEPGNSGSQTTGGATAAILVGQNRLIAINANEDVNIVFGNSAVAATATSFRIPANSTFTFSTSPETTYMSIYNGSGSTATYWWAYLSKF